MKLKDYIVLSLRNISRQKVRSGLAILAIVIAAASVSIVLALTTSAKDFFYNQFAATGQLEQVIVNPESGLDFEQSQHSDGNCNNCTKLTDSMADTIKTYDNVTGLSPTADIFSLESASYNGNKLTINRASGYQPNGVIKHTFLAGGDFNENDDAGKIIISQDYADQLGVKGKYQDIIGKEIDVTTTKYFSGQGATLPDPLVQFKKCTTGCGTADVNAPLEPTTLKATVVGVESNENDSIFVPLSWAQGLLKSQHYEITRADQAAYNQAYDTWNKGGRRGAEPIPQFTLVSDDTVKQDGYGTFVVAVNSPNNTSAVADKIQQLGVGAVSAEGFIEGQVKTFNIVRLILAGIAAVALVVAAIGVVNTMFMAIFERTREIGVFRAVGAKRSTVNRLFTLEASLLGFWGGVFGVAIGYIFMTLANLYLNTQLADNGIAGRNIISLPITFMLGVIATTTVIGMLAGLAPARRAAKLDPVEALHHE